MPRHTTLAKAIDGLRRCSPIAGSAGNRDDMLTAGAKPLFVIIALYTPTNEGQYYVRDSSLDFLANFDSDLLFFHGEASSFVLLFTSLMSVFL